MTIIFFEQKYAALTLATKIFKNQGLSFVFAQMNAAHCISGQNNMVRGEDYSRGSREN